MDNNIIKEKIEELKPWHMSIPINDGIVTAAPNTLQKDLNGQTDISVINPAGLSWFIRDIYGSDNLSDKSLLDIGCNSGGYCFLANELGYDFAEGFDPRPHWIKQANFIKSIKNITDDKLQFSIESTASFNFNKRKYDICVFKGVLYHIADPIHCLKKACEATNDLMLINTAYVPNIDDGFSFRLKMENTEVLMSGVEGLSWHPTGPQVLIKICQFYGFKYHKIIFQKEDTSKYDKRNTFNPSIGRLSLVVSKHQNLIQKIKRRK